MSKSPPDVRITFRPLTEADLPLLHEWLTRPHVAEWWDGTPTLPDVAADYGPVVAGTVPTQAFIAVADGKEIGFIQSYAATGFHHEGWWLDEHDPGVRGIDQFLSEGDLLGKGYGTAMVRSFVAQLLTDPAVTRVQTDPDPSNGRAVRCYEKAGFHAVREIDTPDGRALLMYCDRPASNEP